MKPILNKKARHDYEIVDELVAGIKLTGPEVKSVKSGRVKIVSSYIKIEADAAKLIGVTIPPYKKSGNTLQGYDPERARTLLLTAAELAKLKEKTQQKGITAVPLKLFTKNRLVKLVIGIGRGKKKHDKRESIKKRETDRSTRRKLRAKI